MCDCNWNENNNISKAHADERKNATQCSLKHDKLKFIFSKHIQITRLYETIFFYKNDKNISEIQNTY